MKNHLYLIGFMGVGKTSYGRVLASHLGVDFHDFDQLIEESEGKTIAQLFSNSGEDAFRIIERKQLLKTAERPAAVFATGGGLPCFHRNMKTINQLGTSLYLKATPLQLYYQLRNQQANRPLLQNLNKEELLNYINTKLSMRAIYYEQSQYIYSLCARKTWEQESKDLITFVQSLNL